MCHKYHVNRKLKDIKVILLLGDREFPVSWMFPAAQILFQTYHSIIIHQESGQMSFVLELISKNRSHLKTIFTVLFLRYKIIWNTLTLKTNVLWTVMLVKIPFQKSKHILLNRFKHSNIFNHRFMISSRPVSNGKVFLFTYNRGLQYQHNPFFYYGLWYPHLG